MLTTGQRGDIVWGAHVSNALSCRDPFMSGVVQTGSSLQAPARSFHAQNVNRPGGASLETDLNATPPSVFAHMTHDEADAETPRGPRLEYDRGNRAENGNQHYATSPHRLDERGVIAIETLRAQPSSAERLGAP
jgi:hypothetical protein